MNQMTPPWSLDPNIPPVPWLSRQGKGNTSSYYGRDTMMAPMNPNEYVIPAPVVMHKGTEFFDNLIQKSLQKLMPPEQAQKGGTGNAAQGFATGGQGNRGTEPGGGGLGGGFYVPPAGGITGTYWGGEVGSGLGQYEEPTPLPGTEGGGPLPPPGPQIPTPSFNPQPGQWYGFPETPAGQWVGSGYNPPAGLQGSWQGQTALPTFFDPMGYPYAVPMGGWPSLSGFGAGVGFGGIGSLGGVGSLPSGFGLSVGGGSWGGGGDQPGIPPRLL